ncbi:MAG: hypothetical protein EOP53_08440 [Sphingobacteriales bacterium]|nr:MAG: hypothetical protein EOP53_08440 [Sphingobacteriales bacterium]
MNAFLSRLMLFKNLSAKTKIGAGLSYQHLKEYIQLNGQEINTNYAVVKRLQNGNALVDDTVKSVTRGIRIIDAVNSYSFISIPVALRYNVWQQKNWRFDLSAGIDINIESRYRNSIEGELMPQFAAGNTTRRNNSMGVGYNAAALLGRKMGSRYFIYAAPYIQLNPSKVYLKEMLSPRKLNRSGVSFGLSYGL